MGEKPADRKELPEKLLVSTSTLDGKEKKNPLGIIKYKHNSSMFMVQIKAIYVIYKISSI